ncbi:hypothetical protein [Helicobacter rodentium]|uniref:hypothetical protein n=1 Tax=Helicobacter rodentium TaxID=59617 RepID=UPI0023F2FBBE|nr:hypothetical protein [Helicobacter rodentium]
MATNKEMINKFKDMADCAEILPIACAVFMEKMSNLCEIFVKILRREFAQTICY